MCVHLMQILMYFQLYTSQHHENFMLKKYLLLSSLFLLCLGSVIFAASYGEINTDAEYSIQGLWRFNGGALDETANNNDGNVTGATTTQLGKFGQTYDFDGDADYIDIDDDPTLDFQIFTVSVWLNFDDNIRQQIFSKLGSPTWYEINYSLMFHETAGMLCNTYNTSGTQFQAIMALSNPQTLGWIHVTCVHDGSDIILYYNGAEGARTATSGTIEETTGALRIGMNGAGSREFDGRLDELIVYDRALSATEIRATFAMQKGAYGVID